MHLSRSHLLELAATRRLEDALSLLVKVRCGRNILLGQREYHLAEVVDTDAKKQMLTVKGNLALMKDPATDPDTIALGSNGTGLMISVTLKEVSDRELTQTEMLDALAAMRTSLLTPITTAEVAQLRKRRSGMAPYGSASAAASSSAAAATSAGNAKAAAPAVAEHISPPTRRAAISGAALGRVGDVSLGGWSRMGSAPIPKPKQSLLTDKGTQQQQQQQQQ